jgi:hypothetical protein
LRSSFTRWLLSRPLCHVNNGTHACSLPGYYCSYVGFTGVGSASATPCPTGYYCPGLSESWLGGRNTIAPIPTSVRLSDGVQLGSPLSAPRAHTVTRLCCPPAYAAACAFQVRRWKGIRACVHIPFHSALRRRQLVASLRILLSHRDHQSHSVWSW